MKKIVIVFSGYNQRAVISFLRTLEKNKICYALIASSTQDTIFQSSYADKVEYVRKNKQLDLQEICMAIDLICQKYQTNQCLIAPSTEALNRFLLQYIDVFERHNCIVPLVDEKLYASISDKDSFRKICKENGACVPNVIELPEQFDAFFVAKPKKYVAKDGHAYSPVIITSEKERKDFVETYDRDDFFYEEYIEGESLYLLYYFTKSGDVFHFSQVNYAQQTGGKSILAAGCATLHDEEISNVYEKLFHSLNYFGFVMVEIRKNPKGLFMIEANPRFWGPSQLFCDAGYNFFEVFLWEYGYLADLQEFIIDFSARYFWSGGGDFTLPASFVWHKNGEECVMSEWESFMKADMYQRKDTLKIWKEERYAQKKELLKNLYMKTSKHSNYQIMPTVLRGILDVNELQTQSRYEEERFHYITKYVNIKGKKVLDIGGNSGYFTFESYSAGANMVDYYEGNPVHAEFVKEAVDLLDLQKCIHVYPEYFMFHNSEEKKYDIVFCLNVIHHLGDDFGEEAELGEVKRKMLACINSMAKMTDILVFQMGYNWCGNPKMGLFEGGTKQEMEEYLYEGIQNHWEILKTGIAEKRDGKIQYTDKNERNNLREDALGEFLNRPIFILRSKFVCKDIM